MKWNVVLEQDDDGGYVVHCPALPGCASQGDALDEALANIREAIELCVEVMNDRSKVQRSEQLVEVEV